MDAGASNRDPIYVDNLGQRDVRRAEPLIRPDTPCYHLTQPVLR